MFNQFFRGRLKSKKITAAISLLIISFSAIVLLAMNGSRERQAVGSISQQRDIKIVEKLFPSQAIEIVKIHNPQSEFFPKDFQIEIKNISQKPIYYVNFVGQLPNSKPLYDGLGLGFNLQYGNTRLITNGTLATPDDVPILPGKIGMMTIKSKEAAGLYETLVKTGKFSMLTEKITLVPQFINFGDGSGYLFEKFYGGEKKQVSLNLWDECDNAPGGSCAKWKLQTVQGACALDGCEVQINGANFGGEFCAAVCGIYVTCTDQYGETHQCRSVYLDPCEFPCWEF